MELTVPDGLAAGPRPRLDATRGVLIGTRCPACGTRSWPGRAVCNRCGRPDPDLTDLPTTGRLLSYARVWVKRPGLTPPYTLGQVSLGPGALLFAHIRGLAEGVRVPTEVSLVIGNHESGPVAFWFAANTGQG